MSSHRGACFKLPSAIADKAVCAAAKEDSRCFLASATVPGPEERHRCFGPFERAAQCKTRRPRDESSLVPRGPHSWKRGNLGFGPGNDASRWPVHLAGLDEVELFSFARKKSHGLHLRSRLRARKEDSLPPVSHPSQRVRLARPFKPGVVNLLQEAGVIISGVGVERLAGSRRHQLIRQRVLHAPDADYAVGCMAETPSM